MEATPPNEALAAHLARAGERDAKWRHRLYDLLDTVALEPHATPVAAGPDGFPYLMFAVPPRGRRGSARLPDAIAVATTRGLGAVVTSGDAEPWVFSCGDLATRRAFGTYEFPRLGVTPSDEPRMRDVTKNADRLSIGAPPATLLPGFVQPLLHRYFRTELGIEQPAALAILSDEQHPPEQLVFRVSRDDFEADDDFAAALAGVGWYLPRHTVLCVLPSETVASLERAFVPLRATV